VTHAFALSLVENMLIDDVLCGAPLNSVIHACGAYSHCCTIALPAPPFLQHAHATQCHFWIEWMQTHLDFNGQWWNFLPKVLADQTVYSVVLNAAYTSFVIGLSGEKR
jgi:hypothetical protein